MAYLIEISPEANRDLDLIFEHLFASYMGFGDSPSSALERAIARVRAIRDATRRLASFPSRGANGDDLVPGARHLTMDRVTYWYRIDETTRTVRVGAIFLEGRDQLRHMLLRALRGGA